MEQREQKHQEDLRRLRRLRPIDDDFMRCLFKDNIPLAEFVLRIITDKRDLVITDCQTQKLMHDFNCTKADDMNFALMAERTRYLKENPKGVNEMCKVMEDMRNESLKEGIREGMKEAALRMLTAGKYALEEIVAISGLSLEEVMQLKADRNA